MTLEQAIAKATKLLKLSESSNAHEAALAAQRAQEILARYDIDATALSMDGNGPTIEETINKFEGENAIDSGNSSIARWKIVLASRLASANSCRAYKSGPSIGIIGRPTDVQKVRYLYAVLLFEIERLTDSNAKGMGRSYRAEFRHGVVSAIGDKLREAKQKVAQDMREEAKIDANPNALVRIDNALERMGERDRAVDAWARQNMNFRSSSTSSRHNAEARAAGYSAGQSLNVGGRTGIAGGMKRLA